MLVGPLMLLVLLRPLKSLTQCYSLVLLGPLVGHDAARVARTTGRAVGATHAANAAVRAVQATGGCMMMLVPLMPFGPFSPLMPLMLLATSGL